MAVMGKKKRGDSLKKKHKKNKRKKHHPLEDEVDSSHNDEFVREDITTIQRPIKLKIKIGDKLISSSNATIASPLGGDDASSVAESESRSCGASSLVEGVVLDVTEASSLCLDLPESDLSVGKEYEEEVGSGLDENDEEEAWLDALETGDVNERGYLPQKADSTSLTARQRAMLGGEEGDGGFEELMELPVSRVAEELTEEMLLKKAERNRKRRIAAQKRKEKRKAETVRRLLEKQNTNKKKDEEKMIYARKMRDMTCHIRYINTTRGSSSQGSDRVRSSLSIPEGIDFPLPVAIRSCARPTPVLCAMKGCKNRKKYSDSLTKLPLCSLKCYQVLQSFSKDITGTKSSVPAKGQAGRGATAALVMT